MFDDETLARVVGRIESRFDSVPSGTLRSIVREALVARETVRFDSAPSAPAKPAPARATRTDGLAALKQAQADAFAGAGKREDTAPAPSRTKRTDGLDALRKAQNAHVKGAA